MSQLETIKNHIQQGHLVLYPMPSCWALGCDAKNESALKNLLETLPKADNPYALLVANIREVERFIPEFPDLCYDLVEFATSPLTIIYPGARNISRLLCYTDGSLGIQVTENKFLRSLLQQLKSPLVFVELPPNFNPEQNQNEQYKPIIQAADFVAKDEEDFVTKTPSKILKIGTDSSIQILRS
jgi:L-threonylcarbamoyladenylate synthase